MNTNHMTTPLVLLLLALGLLCGCATTSPPASTATAAPPPCPCDEEGRLIKVRNELRDLLNSITNLLVPDKKPAK